MYQISQDPIGNSLDLLVANLKSEDLGNFSFFFFDFLLSIFYFFKLKLKIKNKEKMMMEIWLMDLHALKPTTMKSCKTEIL